MDFGSKRDTICAIGEGRFPTPLLPVRCGPIFGGELVLADEVGGPEDEYLAHQIGSLLVSAHEPDHPAPGRVFDHALKALAHEVLELHPLLDDRRTAAALEERLLHPGEATTQQADDQVVS